jgi:hypothetical protein
MKKTINQKTFGILTLNDIRNYGNRLQNYALQELLKPYGDTTTIRFETDTASLVGEVKAYLRRFKMSATSHTQIAFRGSSAVEGRHILNNLHFTNEYVPDNKFFITVNHLLKEDEMPDCIVIGSDQVWNYNLCSPIDLRIRLGLFAPSDRLIAYAASIGVSEIPRALQPLYKEAFTRIPSISVREDRAKELIENISGRSATVVLDPTLMLTADKWSTLFREFVPKDDRFILTYFLGEPSEAQEKLIANYAQKHGLRIRRILDKRDPETSMAGPQDFVELFSKTDFVFTDSYHACCFSILFEKNFKVFSRSGFSGKKNMNSRMQTLERLFDLTETMHDEQIIKNIDYSKTDDFLVKLRAESAQWLDQALG